jgi:Protein of unknown function (DUF3489)
MTTFTIDNESNHIIHHVSERDIQVPAEAERFSNEADLENLAASWPMSRLIDIWNRLPGVTPVKKFTNRKTAITRIWNALYAAVLPASETGIEEAPGIEAEEPREAEADPHPEPEEPSTSASQAELGPGVAATVEAPAKKATRKPKTPTSKKAAKSHRGRSKTTTVVELMKRPGGVTLNAIMEATGWQAHSVRGFISGTIGKKMGMSVVSTQAENGERNYSLQA